MFFDYLQAEWVLLKPYLQATGSVVGVGDKSSHFELLPPSCDGIDRDCWLTGGGGCLGDIYLVNRLCPGRRKDVRFDGPFFLEDTTSDLFVTAL